MLKALQFFMDYCMMPVSFVVLLIVQLKILRMLRAHTDLMLFYGKQIEEIRKLAAGARQQPVRPEVSQEDTGLYEVLND